MTLDDIRAALHEIEVLARRPMLRSVTLHPDDFEALRHFARQSATVPLESDEWFGPLRFDGVPIYQSADVPKGRPWYDPPEAGPLPPVGED